MPDKNKDKQVNEPLAFYESKKIKIYSTIEQAEEAQHLLSSNQDPIQRIQETVRLILRVFPPVKDRYVGSKIFFDKV